MCGAREEATLARMSPYDVFIALVVAAFVIGAASRSRWVPWIVPAGMVVYWVVATVQLAAEGDNGTGEDQTGLAVFVGVLAVSVLAAAVGAGRLLRFWLRDRW
jgi:hypothetical protein